LRGGQDKVHEAGAVIAGGHTIIDEELKFGLAVTGRADPRRLLTNASAAVGDKLLLTKPLGTGILATAAKNGRLSAEELDSLIASMALLNRDASRAALTIGATCATDVTGFGLLGHANHIAKASKKTLRINVARVPALPNAREMWRGGVRTGGAERNEEYLRDLVDWGNATDVDRALVIDPQTSGGLLVAVSPRRVAEYLSLVPSAVEIGDVVAPSRLGIVLV
jgi:selenide,water dikinase